MENKYEVIAEEQIRKDTTLYTLIDIETKEDYSAIIDKTEDIVVLYDEMANKYDIAEGLFQYDLDLFNIIPINMITPNMVRCYEDYYPGKGHCNFRSDEEYEKAYKEEEERINKMNKPKIKVRRIK